MSRKGAYRYLSDTPWLLPAVLLVVGVVINLVTPRHIWVGASFAAAPMVAAAFWTARGTLLTAVLAVLTMGGLLWYWGELRSADTELRLGTIATVALLSLLVNRALRTREARAASFRQVAEAVQTAMLPPPPRAIDGFVFAVRYEAAHRDAQVGGDLYAVQQTPYGVRLMVGDVRGKGLDAIGGVSVVSGAFREAADGEADLVAVVDRIEQSMMRNSERRDGGLDHSERFVTMVVAEIPTGRPGTLRVINRGHPAPLLLAADGSGLRQLDPARCGLPVGLGDLDGSAGTVADEVAFPPGTLLLLYTDGVTEARDTTGTFYDPVARLRGRRFPCPDELVDAVAADVRRHTGGKSEDDAVLLAVMHGSGPDPADPAASGRSAASSPPPRASR